MSMERVSRWVEILANLGVIVTLLLLVAEVRDNTLALQRQAFLDRSTAMNIPFLQDGPLPGILAAIKSVDGWEGSPFEQAFADRYGVPIEDAIVWARHLSMVWGSLDADYQLAGASPALAARVRLLLTFPDNQLLWRTTPELFSSEFRTYVAEQRPGA